MPDYGTEEVSDHALALLMAVSRRVVTRDAAVRRGIWNVGQQEQVVSSQRPDPGTYWIRTHRSGIRVQDAGVRRRARPRARSVLQGFNFSQTR